MARGKPFQKGQARPPGGGRKPGTTNVVTRAFKDTLAAVLDTPETEAKLIELRDSEESMDRATFWRMAAKFVPQKIEADINTEVTLRIVDRTDARRE